MTSATLLWLSVFALAVASFAAIGVYVLRDFSRSYLRDLLTARDLLSRYNDIIAHRQSAALGAESVRVIASAAAVLAAAASLWEVEVGQAAWPGSLLAVVYFAAGAILLWLAILWLPTAIARLWADAFLARTWPVWRIASFLTAPSIIGAALVEKMLHFVSGQQPKPLTEEELEEEIREVVNEGQREGLLEEDAREMIESVMGLGEVYVSEIMTPRIDMIALPVDIAWDEALEIVVSSGHTRFPVHGKSRDEIVGILHIKEMLHEMVHTSPQRRSLDDLMRPPFFIPETKPVDDLLQEFQRGRTHIAIVVDEFGGVSGLVTIEDVLEEIVGEIADEHDEAATVGIKPTGEHTCEALARVHVSEINERLGSHLPEDEHFDTIGGFVFHQLGRIPHAGEEVVYDGVKIKVLEATRRRINRVAIECLPPEDPDNHQSSSESEVRSDGMD